MTPDALRQLNRAARRYKRLTKGAETRLAKRIERGDLKAKERLINHNLRLVARAAYRRYVDTTLNGTSPRIEDLIETGQESLVLATERFKGDKQERFSTYASRQIRAAMLRSTKTTLHLVDEGTSNLAEILLDPSAPDPAVQLIEADTCRELRAQLKSHLGLAADVLILKYGIGGVQQRNFEQIGDLLDITTHEAARLHEEGLKMLLDHCPPEVANLLGAVFQQRAESYHQHHQAITA